MTGVKSDESGVRAVAVDVGGTTIKWCAFVGGTPIGPRGTVPTPHTGGLGVVNAVRRIVTQATKAGRVDAVGLSTGGIVDDVRGVVAHASETMLGYAGTDWRCAMRDLVGDAVHVENDAVAALVGERWRGAVVGADRVYCVTLGTGVGGAYFGSAMERGAHGQADAIGYLPCGPGSGDTFDALGSTSGLVRLASEAMGYSVSAEDVFTRVRNGDVSCTELLETWAGAVARGLAAVILIRDPQHMVLGGGISAQGPFLVDLVARHLRQSVPRGFELPELHPAKLGNDAALYGAVYSLVKARL